MPKTSTDTSNKSDAELAAKNKDISDLRGEVGALKKYIGGKAAKEAKDAEESRRLSKNIKGLGRLGGLNSGLGNQSFKK